MRIAFLPTLLLSLSLACPPTFGEPTVKLHLPDPEIAAAYEAAATNNVLSAVNPDIFPGYWSVCADGIGHGHGNTFPALDGHQMADALLYLGQVETVKLNWDYVKSFQRPDGQLPFAILPASAGKAIGPPESQATVDPNGGLYEHWVPDNPLRALGYPTYIQNADVFYRLTLDIAWLTENLPSVNLAAEYFATMVTDEGAVGGAGYYVERPTRVEFDGVTQGHAADAFRRLAALNRIVGNHDGKKRYRELAQRIETHFQTQFWAGEHFAEYIHPQRGAIASHGLTDSDWTAIATGIATTEQQAKLWPQLKSATGFRYGGMPTGIATKPETYETWEFSHDDRMDLAAMGRVWYIECWARAQMGDGDGLVAAIHPVCAEGKANDYYWRERYNAEGGFGVEKYCEYPANLIRIVQRFLMGVEYGLDGSLTLAPTVPESWWKSGFGQTLTWQGRKLTYRFKEMEFSGSYSGKKPLVLTFQLKDTPADKTPQVEATGLDIAAETTEDGIKMTLTPSGSATEGTFTVSMGLPRTPTTTPQNNSRETSRAHVTVLRPSVRGSPRYAVHHQRNPFMSVPLLLFTIASALSANAATLTVAAHDAAHSSKAAADYVCDGDGDQTEINAAIAALPDSGGTVQLTEGAFDIRREEGKLGGVLIERSNVTLAGRGPATKLIQAPEQETNVIRIIGSGVGYVTIRDLYVDANRDANPLGEGDPDVSHARFEFCGIKAFRTYPGGPSGEDTHHITVRNCHVINARRLGIMLEGPNMHVVDNILGNANSDVVEILTGPGEIRGNYAEITGRTHVAYGSDRGNHIIMSDNIIHVRPDGDIDIGFRSWADSKHHAINGNVIRVDKGGKLGRAMDIRGTETAVTGNSIHNHPENPSLPLYIRGGNTVLTGNVFENMTLIVNDETESQLPIRIETNILDNTTIDHRKGNLNPPE